MGWENGGKMKILNEKFNFMSPILNYCPKYM